jgi:hypothetical protein
MVAFSASKLVCCAIDVITSITFPISTLESPSFDTVSLADSAGSDRLARHFAPLRLALWATSPMDRTHLTSSAPEASVCRLALTCPAGLGDHMRLRRRFLGVGRDLLAGRG